MIIFARLFPALLHLKSICISHQGGLSTHLLESKDLFELKMLSRDRLEKKVCQDNLTKYSIDAIQIGRFKHITISWYSNDIKVGSNQV